MIQIPWASLTTRLEGEASALAVPDGLRAEIEERLQLGDTLVVTDIPPAGETRRFDQPAKFRRWLALRSQPATVRPQ